MESTSQALEAFLRIQMEYLEMPHLKLTKRQVQRLWTLSNDVCEAVLVALVQTGFLAETPDGAYVRRGRPHAWVEQPASLVRAS